MAVLEAPPAPSAALAPARLEDILERIRPAAMAMLHRYRIPEDDFDDILQDALLVFVLRRPAVAEPEKWLLGTLRNRCLMFWRDRRRTSLVTTNSALIDLAADPRISGQERDSLLADLRRMLARLPAHYRRVLEARYLRGLSPAETARQLGYRPSGIYKIIERARSELKREMRREGYRERTAWTA